MLTHPNVVFLLISGPRHFLQLCFFGLHVPNNQLRVPANSADPRIADTHTEGRGMRIVFFKYVLSGDGDTGTQQHLLTDPYCTSEPGFLYSRLPPTRTHPLTMPLALDEPGRNHKVKVLSERKREGQDRPLL